MSLRPSAAPHARGALLSALRAFGGTLAEIFGVRGALLAIEAREEIERRRQMLLLAALGLGFLHAALLLLALFVTVAFWDAHRLAAVGAMTILYLCLGGAALRRLRREAAACPPPFAASMAELERDLAALRASP